MADLICFHDPEDENPWFSNWYRSDFYLGGTTFTSMEQYMMAHKAGLFGDGEAMQAILSTDDPAEIKAWGRRVRGYNDRIWNGLRQIIVYEGLVEKFRQNVELRRHLLDTGDATLAECSAADRIRSGSSPRTQAYAQAPQSSPISAQMTLPGRFGASTW